MELFAIFICFTLSATLSLYSSLYLHVDNHSSRCQCNLEIIGTATTANFFSIFFCSMIDHLHKLSDLAIIVQLTLNLSSSYLLQTKPFHPFACSNYLVTTGFNLTHALMSFFLTHLFCSMSNFRVCGLSR